MPHFDYKARSKEGRIETGSIEGADRRSAIHRLQEQGLSPVTVVAGKAAKPGVLGKLLERGKALQTRPKSEPDDAALEKLRGKAPKREQVGLSLLKRLLELHSSGMPIGDAIRILSQRLSQPEQKELASTLWRDLSDEH